MIDKQTIDDDVMNKSEEICYTMMQLMMIMMIGYGMIRVMEYVMKLFYNFYVVKVCCNEKKMNNEVNEKFEDKINNEYYLTEYGEKIHISKECDGLQNRTSRLKKYEMCVLCKRSRNERSERKLRSRP